ncbi:hypothetical protein HK102_009033, partial [Quaeritorhiza haematococci]
GVKAYGMECFEWLLEKIYRLEEEGLENRVRSSTKTENPHKNPRQRFTIFGSDRPTQILINEYLGPMGISHHHDTPHAFGDSIVTLSLGQPIWMTLQLPRGGEHHPNPKHRDIVAETRILLEPGSLLVMRDEARYKWTHGIGRSRYVAMPDGSWRYRDE